MFPSNMLLNSDIHYVDVHVVTMKIQTHNWLNILLKKGFKMWNDMWKKRKDFEFSFRRIELSKTPAQHQRVTFFGYCTYISQQTIYVPQSVLLISTKPIKTRVKNNYRGLFETLLLLWPRIFYHRHLQRLERSQRAKISMHLIEHRIFKDE